MASTARPLRTLAVAILVLVVAADVASAAITCGFVVSKLGQCLNYVRGSGPLTQPCCAGIKALNQAAASTPDRQATCRCLKSLASGLNPGLAAGLPRKCGVSIPYPISTSIDCSTVR